MNFKELLAQGRTTRRPIVESIDNSIDRVGRGESDNDLGYWYNMKNPETGLRYDIPMLDSLDPEYYFKYVYYMKLKDSAPDTFEQILKWD